MATMIILALISLCWLAVGFMMAVAPAVWRRWLTRSLTDSLPRFLIGNGILLLGLLLLAGSPGLQGRWLWAALGGVAVVKALLLLGLSDPYQRAWVSRWQRLPAIIHRLAGVLYVALATLLAIDTIRGPQ
jgi:threonine/homoserine/homoserine lactone efflux protein